MIKKALASASMLMFLGFGTVQLFAKVPTNNILICDFAQELACQRAYSGASLGSCVCVANLLRCSYTDGTTKFINE